MVGERKIGKPMSSKSLFRMTVSELYDLYRRYPFGALEWASQDGSLVLTPDGRLLSETQELCRAEEIPGGVRFIVKRASAKRARRGAALINHLARNGDFYEVVYD